MDIIAQVTAALEPPASTISRLQGEAWAAWNASYSAEDRTAYQTVSRQLYRQDVHERIVSLFTRSDEQNRRLDALLCGSAKVRKGRKSSPSTRSVDGTRRRH